MSPHPQANARLPALPEHAVQWFGDSGRLVGGRPDARYGWLALPDGLCIVKAMDAELVAYNQTLLDHERRMLRRLRELDAPAPHVVEAGRGDWLVTRFAGLSLQRAAHPGGLQGQLGLSLHEQLSAWVHTLRRLQHLAAEGVLVVDLYGANIVLPLTNGTQGQLRLNQPVLIDHAHTLESGSGLCRPVWLDRTMRRIAPELREALRQDQEALLAHLRAHGAEPPGYSRLPGDRDALSRRLWAEYDAEQALQLLLDSGRLDPGRAMQYAAACDIQRILQRQPVRAALPALQAVLAAMAAEQPAARLATLAAAADALGEAVTSDLGELPRVSRRRVRRLQPSDLRAPDVSRVTPDIDTSAQDEGGTAIAAEVDSPSASLGGTATVGSPMPAPQGDAAALPRQRRSLGWPVVWYALAAAGAVLGAWLPLPV